MNQNFDKIRFEKGFVSVILAVVIVLAVGAVGYFAWVKKSKPVAPQSTATPSPSQSPSSTPANLKTTTNKIVPLQKSGIKGTVMLNDKPLAKFTLNITNEIPDFSKQVTTDDHGQFQIELSPGQYVIAPGNGNSQDTEGGPFSVEVKPGIFKEAKLQFSFHAP